MLVVFGVSLYVLNLGYGFLGSFRRLETYSFVSRTLAGTAAGVGGWESSASGNRFAGTWLGRIPVPLPEDYVAGMDVQKRDFEQPCWSYLGGEWRDRGWWYYYLYGLAIKVPLGTWLLMALVVVMRMGTAERSVRRRDEVVLLAPALVILMFVSSQTGFTRHLRYVLPIFPFVFIWLGQVVRVLKSPREARVAAAALAWSIASSLFVYPHSLSYFNELIGGPQRGHWHMENSNIDWGQDLLYLKRWLDRHPEASPLGLASGTTVVRVWRGLSLRCLLRGPARAPARQAMMRRALTSWGRFQGGTPLTWTVCTAPWTGTATS